MSTEEFYLAFPDEYPELIAQMGQIIGRRLVKHGMSVAEAKPLAYEMAEGIRTEIGGVQQYIPLGRRFDLSRRDEQIYAKFNGKNYHLLAREFHLTEMQIRNICNRGMARDRASRQFSLIE